MRSFISLTACLLLAGCTLKPSFEEPKAQFSTQKQCTEENSKYFKVCENNISEEQFHLNKEWWKSFNDDRLNSLIQQALRNNTDLKIAFVRFEQAAENLGIDRSDLLPKLDASAGAARSSTGKNATGTGRRQTGNSFNMGLNLSYELDLWGKYRDQYGAASSAYEASAYDFEAARLSLTSSVAKLYFNAINLARQVQILQDSVTSYEQSYQLKLDQFEVGAISEYELYNYKAQLESAKTQLENARLSKDSNEQALAILVSGSFDDILYKNFDDKDIKDFKLSLPSGITSEILLQRPDIRAGLSRLEQSNYLVGVARSAYLPSISLTGLLGFQSLELSNIVQSQSIAYNGAASLAMPIFRWGEINSNVNLAKLSKDEAYLNYENILKTAFSEVRTALIQREVSVKNEENYANLLESQKKIYDLAQVRYDNGSISLSDLLDARRNFLNASLNYENAQYTLLSSGIDVIKAFGGGFDSREDYEENLEKNSSNLDMSFRE